MHYSTLAALLTTSSFLSLGNALPGDRRQEQCSSIHLLVARGSTEPQGPGQLMSLAGRIIQANPGASMESIIYPAKLNPYGPSVQAGTTAVKQQLSSYVQQCPDSKIVLLGYSQGAQIIGDALCGGDAAGTGPVTPPLDGNITDHVTGVVWYGDPRHTAQQPFNEGSATTDGIYARPASESCDRFAAVIASYCDTGDPYCARGNNVQVHLTYPSRRDAQAATFIDQKLGSEKV